MSLLKTLSLATLSLFVALALNADPAMAKPKNNKNHHQENYDDGHYGKAAKKHAKAHAKAEKKHAKAHAKADKGHGHGHGKFNCDRPYGLAKQDKMPPGWAKKCGHRNKHATSHDSGIHGVKIHHDKHKTAPCKNTVLSGKAKDIATGAAMGSVLGGVIGSGTGDAEIGAIFGGVVGGVIGATAGDGNKSNQPKC